MALPAFVQQTSGVATGFVGSVTSTNFASSVTTGNAILVALVNQGTTTNTTTVSDSSGTNVYTRLSFDVASSYYSAVHICYNATGGANFNVTVSDSNGNDADFVAIEISNVVATETVNNVSGTDNSQTTPSISTTGPTVNANDILIGVFTCEANPMTYTVGAGYSNLKQATGHTFSYNIATETQVVSSTGTYSASMGGQGTSLGASAFIIALSNTVLNTDLSVNVSDSSSITFNVKQTLVSGINKSDSATITENIVSGEGDNVNVTDSTSTADVLEGYSDTIASRDQSFVIAEADPQISDNISATENIPTPAVSYLISVSDPSTITENPIVVVPAIGASSVNVSDSTATSESLSLLITSFVNTTSSTSISENIIPELNSFLIVSDNLTTTENLLLLNSAFINLSNSLSISETVIWLLTSLINITDNSSVADSPIVSGDKYPSVADTINFSEALLLLDSDGIGILDNVSTTESLSLQLSDPQITTSTALTISEALSELVTSFITTSASTVTTENIQLLTEALVNVNNNLTTAESLTQLLSSPISVSDSLITSESLIELETSFISSSDSTATTESVTISIQSAGSAIITTNDNLTITESLSFLVTALFVTVNDNGSITEALLLQDQDGVAILDSLATSESAQLQVSVAISVSDTSSTTENLKLASEDLISLTNSSVITDSVQLLLPVLINIANNLTIVDSPQVVVVAAATLSINTSDSLVITESLGPALFISIVVSDSSGLSEAVTLIISILFITVNDSLLTVDSPNIRVVGDTIAVSDSFLTNENLSLTQVYFIKVIDNSIIAENTAFFTYDSSAAELNIQVREIISNPPVKHNKSVNAVRVLETNLQADDTGVMIQTRKQ